MRVDNFPGSAGCPQNPGSELTQTWGVMIRVPRVLWSSLPARFLVDFWHSPRAAVRRYAKRRTWPTSSELDKMNPDEFEAYMRSIGMVAVPIETGNQSDAGTRDLLTRIP